MGLDKEKLETHPWRATESTFQATCVAHIGACSSFVAKLLPVMTFFHSNTIIFLAGTLSFHIEPLGQKHANTLEVASFSEKLQEAL